MKNAFELWDSFLIAFTALLPIINPLGSSLVFLGLAGDVPTKSYRVLARKIAINNIVFLAIIELVGTAILRFFGISLPIVQVAGGIVIAAMGWSVLNERDSAAPSLDKREQTQLSGDSSVRALELKAFYPFTFPVTSGPGTLVVTLTLAARAENGGIVLNALRHSGLFLAVVVVSALVYICYANAPRVARAIPAATAHGIVRVVAFILLCIGVQIAWNGFAALLPTILGH